MTEGADHEFLTTIDGVGATVATNLLERYGSADAVLDAHEAGLEGVDGVGPTVVENITNTDRSPSSTSDLATSNDSEIGAAAKAELMDTDGVGEAVAERLLRRFGSVAGVMNADRNELTSVSGVGKTVAVNLGTEETSESAPARSHQQSATATQPPTDQEGGTTGRDEAEEGFTVRNMVLSGGLGQELLLKTVAIDMRHATVEARDQLGERLVYNPPNHAGTVDVTTGGTVRIVGVASVDEADELAESFLADLPPVGIDKTELNLEIANVVATATVDNPVPLAGLAAELDGLEAEYDSDGFPGYSFTLPETSCTFTLFGTGKVTITGAHSVDEAKCALETLNTTLDSFDPEELRTPNDAVHTRVDEIASELEAGADAVAEAHELVDVYDAAVPGSSRGDDGVASTALYLASERDTQSTVAEVADVSVVTIRNISKEFRDMVDSETE